MLFPSECALGELAEAAFHASPIVERGRSSPDARFVLKPDFNGRVRRQMSHMCAQCRFEVFFMASTTLSSCAGWRGRALMSEKPVLQKRSDIALVKVDLILSTIRPGKNSAARVTASRRNGKRTP